MQRGSEAPILAGPGPLPVVLFSHGYAGSPIDGTYLGAQLTLASFGYVTVAPFHGDLRWSLLGFEAILDEGITALTLWERLRRDAGAAADHRVADARQPGDRIRTGRARSTSRGSAASASARAARR